MGLAQMIAPMLALLAATAAAGQGVVLPSGKAAEPLPVIWDEDAAILRLRYVVPGLDGGAAPYAQDLDLTGEDMRWLCDRVREEVSAELGDLPAQGWTGAAVTLMDREVEFGAVDAEAFQLFEWFHFEQDGCVIDFGEYDDD